jgi:uncharacterized protein (DUF952 family)
VTDPSADRERASRLFHLATDAQWDAALACGELRPASLAAEGFVHCSITTQLVGTIERHFDGVDELCLVELAPDLPDLRWEESRPGELYPHLYRPIGAADVVGVHRWRRSADGTVELPQTVA